MSGDGLVWSVLISILIVLNLSAVLLYRKGKMPLWGSGLIIGILGPIIALISGSIFLKIDHSMGGEGFGAAFSAAFIGFVIVGNGILYLIVGLLIVITKFIRKRQLDQR
ncbi:ABC transporter permease [Exiguobacterium sp. RIT594]|uniref:ABC transporter permease n=1 Tax=Exiguobacterium sp. RIT594 TaxID=2282449 RepID=UPI000DF8364B|nr:ABC transporter permease [Exiguobacterium sp. RIT594]RDB34385.1 ABC transporter permease [Exiguobacterium sp. RIT594]